MADVTTLAESAQAIFCAYADYVGESKAQEKLNIKTYPTFDSFALKERKDLEAAIKGVDVDAPAKEIFEEQAHDPDFDKWYFELPELFDVKKEVEKYCLIDIEVLYKCLEKFQQSFLLR